MEKEPKVEGYYRFILSFQRREEDNLVIAFLECGHRCVVRTDIPMWNREFWISQNVLFCFKCGNKY